ARVHVAMQDSLRTVWRLNENQKATPTPAPQFKPVEKRGGIGAIYCTFITKYFHVKEAAAAELPVRALRTPVQQQDTTKRQQDTTKRKQQDTTKKKAAAAASAPATAPATAPQ